MKKENEMPLSFMIIGKTDRKKGDEEETEETRTRKKRPKITADGNERKDSQATEGWKKRRIEEKIRIWTMKGK